MVTIRKRKIGNEEFFYLEHSIRSNGNVEKIERYLGKDIPKDIEKLKQEFYYELFKKKWLSSLDKIKQNFIKEYSTLPQSVREKYIEHFMIKFTYDSNRIEGSTLTLKDTANLLKDGIAPNNRPINDIKETESHKKIFYEMLGHKKEINLATVLYWHKILLQDTKPDIAGKIRNYQVAISGSNVELPFPAELDILIREFFSWYSKAKLHPLELAALVHLKFVTIHPFGDGNGRISRMMMNFMLKKHGFPMLNINYSNRAAYYKALERSQKTGKENIFVLYLIKRYLKEYKRYCK